MPSDTIYSGKIAYSRINLGKGSYVKDNKFDIDEDPFAYTLGLTKLLPKKDPSGRPKPTEDKLPNAFDDTKPVRDSERPNLTDLAEYGYGFWLRYLHAYPKRLLRGISESWYFVARVTKNNPYDNVRMGDR